MWYYLVIYVYVTQPISISMFSNSISMKVTPVLCCISILEYFHVCKNVSQFNATFSVCNCKSPYYILAFGRFIILHKFGVDFFVSSRFLYFLLFESSAFSVRCILILILFHMSKNNSIHPECCRQYHIHNSRCYEYNKLVARI